ncbi:chromate efflux transporter [Undibacterium fentianense]|uniref:Chromate efflux transporter n=1 Tax=Undibacterium fentianense TaxID=2828728 RepID=A0A941E1I1_9BURK|nr:chromate efflux transporter [Undibacterium fentianense]MBR7800680.1 chromate efflux transporter [Undibacterium fentianense]
MSEHSTTSPSFSEACRFWFKLGCISFGGPAGQIAIMHQELVEQRRWISERRFLHALNYCMVLPGPEAQQLATYLGWLLHGTPGGIVAGSLFVLPSLLLIIILSWVYLAFGNLPIIAGILYGIKPAVAAIVIHASYKIGTRTLKNSSLYGIAAIAFIALFAFQVGFPFIILGAAVLGLLGGRWIPQHFCGSHASANTNPSPAHQRRAVIDDDSPRAQHTLFHWSGLSRVILTGLFLWALPLCSLWIAFGWQHSLTQMAWFFTKTALLTFGGAYAVLPYVMQEAVDYYRWLTPTQMMDGLALGESTPGPLIMVLSFVGFVTAYVQQLFGPEQLFLAGSFAAILVTWFTFLPSFIFILAGGPLIESSQGKLQVEAPLNAITAAVVGVVLNLAIFFTYHIVWPHGFNAQIDTLAGLMTACAVIALFHFKAKIQWTLILFAGLGLSFQLL